MKARFRIASIVVLLSLVGVSCGALAMDFLRTVIVGRGTPSEAGRFNDKPSLRVDDWEGNPFEGNVYVACPNAGGLNQNIYGAGMSLP